MSQVILYNGRRVCSVSFFLLSRYQFLLDTMQSKILFIPLLLWLLLIGPVQSRRIQTKIVILGAGAAGISAAKTLTESNIQDFIILDAQSFIGGNYDIYLDSPYLTDTM